MASSAGSFATFSASLLPPHNLAALGKQPIRTVALEWGGEAARCGRLSGNNGNGQSRRKWAAPSRPATPSAQIPPVVPGWSRSWSSCLGPHPGLLCCSSARRALGAVECLFPFPPGLNYYESEGLNNAWEEALSGSLLILCGTVALHPHERTACWTIKITKGSKVVVTVLW